MLKVARDGLHRLDLSTQGTLFRATSAVTPTPQERGVSQPNQFAIKKKVSYKIFP